MRTRGLSRLSFRLLLALVTGLVTLPSPVTAQTLRVLQWNTYHGGYGTDGVYDQDRQVGWMVTVAPDVISLNEVKSSQAAAYKQKLEAATAVTWHSFHVVAQSDGTGNQILSRFPILASSIYRMATNGQYARAVAHATLDIGGRTLHVFSTHLDHIDPAIRQAQVAELMQFVSQFPEPRIVAGDLNAAPGSAEVSLLTHEWVDAWDGALHVERATAYAPDNPADWLTRTLRERIDYILVGERGGFAVRAGDIPDTRDLSNPNVTRTLDTLDDRGVRPSDHNLYLATIELGPLPASDPTPPTVSLLEPVVNSDLSGVVMARADAHDDIAVVKVQFVVDGQILGTDRWAPYEAAIDTNRLAIGTHTIEAIAMDAAGNQGSSGSRTFTVGGTLSLTDEIVLHTIDAPVVVGSWRQVTDASAASGSRLYDPDASAAKVTTALANPSNYFEMVFDAAAGQPYRLWMRLVAERNRYYNDSVHVQFDGAVTATGAPVYQIGTTSATEVNLEDCSGCGLAGWGWQDNGWGAGVLGPEIRFATHGPQRIRVQTREDGVSIDQIVLSASRYRTSAPGTLKNDSTILQKPVTAPDNQRPTVTLSAPSSGSSFVAPAEITVTAAAADTDGTIERVEFFAGATMIGVSTSAPYSIQWSSVPAGTYTLTATAVDDDGAAGTSAAVSIGVSEPPPPPPPPDSELVLTGTIFRSRSQKAVDLSWTGSSASAIDILRDGQRIATVSNSGTYRDDVAKPRTFTYQVCEAGTATCSNVITIGF